MEWITWESAEANQRRRLRQRHKFIQKKKRCDRHCEKTRLIARFRRPLSPQASSFLSSFLLFSLLSRAPILRTLPPLPSLSHAARMVAKARPTAAVASGSRPDMSLLVSRPRLHFDSRSSANHQTDADIPYEQDVYRNQGTTRPWLSYIRYKVQHGTLQEQAYVMERACMQLPRSYKLWKMVSCLVCMQ